MSVKYTNQKILAVINSIYEYEAIRKFVVKSQLLNNSVIKVVARVRDHEFDKFEPSNDLEIISLSNTSQSWLKFLSSAKSDFKKLHYIIKKEQFSTILFFSRYDPILHFFYKNIKFQNTIEVYQTPYMEFETKSQNITFSIRSAIKSMMLFMFSGQLCTIKYRDGMHEIFFCNSENAQKLRLYPQKNQIPQFEFGRFNPSKCLKPKLFVTSPLYSLEGVDFKKFVSETIALILHLEITMVCFHPREIKKFKELIRLELGHCTFFDGVSSIKDLQSLACVSVSSSVCFTQVALGNDAYLFPSEFPSLKHVDSVRKMMKYLEDLSEEEMS